MDIHIETHRQTHNYNTLLPRRGGGLNYTNIKISVECYNAVIATITSQCRYDLTVAAAAASERIALYPAAKAGNIAH